MDPTVKVAIIAGITGLISGVIGSLIAPWANWAIEKRKQKLTYRKELITNAREAIANFLTGELYKERIERSRPLLPFELMIKLGMQKDVIYFFHEVANKEVIGENKNEVYQGEILSELTTQLLNEIAKKEKEWDLLD